MPWHCGCLLFLQKALTCDQTHLVEGILSRAFPVLFRYIATSTTTHMATAIDARIWASSRAPPSYYYYYDYDYNYYYHHHRYYKMATVLLSKQGVR